MHRDPRSPAAPDAPHRLGFEEAPEASLLANAQGRCVDANRRAREWLLHPAAHFVDRPLAELVIADERERFVAAGTALQPGEASTAEWTVHRGDGTSALVELTLQRLSNGGLLGRLREPGRRAAATAGSLSADARLESVLLTANDIVLIADREGSILGISRATPPLVAAQVVGTNCLLYVPPASQSRIRAAIDFVFRTGQVDEYCVQMSHETTGLSTWYQVRVGPVVERGEVVAVTMCSLDITGRKAAEEAFLNLAKGVSGHTGPDLFETLATYLAHGLRADATLIGTYLPDRPGHLRTLAVWRKGRIAENFDYELADTPCAALTGESMCSIPAGAHARFPRGGPLADLGAEACCAASVRDSHGNPTGIILALWRAPLLDSPLAESLLRTFAASAGAEVERLRAEAELRTANQRLALATRSGRIGIWDWDVTTNHLVWDHAMYALYGIRAEDFGGAYEAWERGVHPEDLPRARAEVTAALAGVRDFHTEFRVVWPDGQIRFIEGHATVERTPEGQARRMIGVNLDVSDRKLADRAVRESEARYRTLFDNAPEAIVVLDVDSGKFVDVNENALRLFGCTRDELTRRGPAEVSPEIQPDGRPSREAAVEWVRQAVAGGNPQFEWIHQSVAGDDIPCEIRLVRLPSTTQVLVRGSIVDISERKRSEAAKARLEDQLRQAQKLESIGRLAGGVAHDFNNLLTSILGFAELAKASVPPGSEVARNIGFIADSATRGGALTQQLLAYARKRMIKPEIVDLNQIIAGLEPILRRLIGEDIEVRIALGEGPLLVKVDVGSIEQVVMNLAVNARDAMRAGGRLEIESHALLLDEAQAERWMVLRAGPHVGLRVTDTGMGIPPDVLPRVFEPFFTTKPVGKGTGLGLATCQGIVRQAGGQIAVHTEVGAGSTFEVLLPRCADAAASADAGTRDARAAGGRETILVAEDEPSVRECTRRALSRLGYRVLVAADGAEALELAAHEAGRIDLLVTDVIMPKLGGFELADRLQARSPGLRVLYVSGHTEDHAAHARVLQDGVHFVQKPYSPSSLAEHVRNVLDGRR